VVVEPQKAASLQPRSFSDVKNEISIAREEIFGPPRVGHSGSLPRTNRDAVLPG